MNRVTFVTSGLALCLTILGGCKRDIQNTDAVRQGVLNYLSKRSDLLSMDVSIANVSFRDNEATATVHLQAKGSNLPGSGMDMRYLLERKGNDWVVKGRAGGEVHGQGMSGHPGGQPSGQPDGQPGGQAGEPGSIGAMPQTLPPGHPAIPSKQPEPPK